MAKKSDKKVDPAYIALAEGPGSLARAAELAAAQPRSEQPGEPDEEAVGDVVSGQRPAKGFRREDGTPVAGSPAYLRMLEELSFFVAPAVAHKMLDLSLEEAGTTPEDATTLELREILVEPLPECLAEVLEGDALETALAVLEDVLVNIHQPPRGQRPSGRSHAVSTPSRPSTPSPDG